MEQIKISSSVIFGFSEFNRWLFTMKLEWVWFNFVDNYCVVLNLILHFLMLFLNNFIILQKSFDFFLGIFGISWWNINFLNFILYKFMNLILKIRIIKILKFSCTFILSAWTLINFKLMNLLLETKHSIPDLFPYSLNIWF